MKLMPLHCKETAMKLARLSVASLLFIFSTLALAQPPQSGTAPPFGAAPQSVLPTFEGPTIDIVALIEKLSIEMTREFIVDQRLPLKLPAINTAVEDADFDTLRALMRSSGMAIFETADQVFITSEALIRSMPTRIVQRDDRRVSDNEVITRVIEVSGLPAAQLVPILRPMMPQSAQLGAIQGTNKLIIVDYYDNVRRISAVIAEMVEGITTD
jgi:general secretion pathway protein D